MRSKSFQGAAEERADPTGTSTFVGLDIGAPAAEEAASRRGCLTKRAVYDQPPPEGIAYAQCKACQASVTKTRTSRPADCPDTGSSELANSRRCQTVEPAPPVWIPSSEPTSASEPRPEALQQQASQPSRLVSDACPAPELCGDPAATTPRQAVFVREDSSPQGVAAGHMELHADVTASPCAAAHLTEAALALRRLLALSDVASPIPAATTSRQSESLGEASSPPGAAAGLAELPSGAPAG